MTEQHDGTKPLPTAGRAVPLLIVVVSVCLFLIFVGRAKPPALAQSTERAAAAQQSIGRECQQCHRANVESFPLGIHGKSAKFLKDSRAASCKTCHANSEKHAETSTQTKSGEPAGSPANMSTSLVNETCLQCHSQDRSHFEWRGGKHDRGDMSCVSCHSVHHSKSQESMLANFTVEDTCLRCHTDKRKALFQRSTHLFRTENRLIGSPHEGSIEDRVMKVTCVTCHNPHGGEGPKMLQASSTNGLCYQCHAEKRGPFLWEHSPVQENCMVCHTPHGSNNTSLLITRPHQLCQQCHINLLARHQTVAGFDVFTFNRSCVNCHNQVHGSNHPSGKALTR